MGNATRGAGNAKWGWSLLPLVAVSAVLAAAPAAGARPVPPSAARVDVVAPGATNWNGRRWSGMKGSGRRWSGMKWNGMKWLGAAWDDAS